jgi:hypothetical protein
MKIPWYETSPGALEQLLLTKSFVQCNLYTLTLSGGDVYRWAVNDRDVVVPGGCLWSAKGALFECDNNKPQAHWKVGTDVDTYQVPLAIRSYDPITGVTNPDTLGAVPLVQALRARALDGATLQVDCAVWATWPDAYHNTIFPVGVVTVFYGLVGPVDVSRNQAVVTTNSYTILFTKDQPRNVFSPGCRHTLFDVGCTLSAAAFVRAGVALTGSGGSVLLSAITAPAGSGTYALGRVVMTSGQNNGFQRAVRSWTSGTFQLLSPFYFPIAAGDTFNAYPGCDKNYSTCTAFSNVANFGGQRFIPAAETAV